MTELDKILEGLDDNCDYKHLYITTIKLIRYRHERMLGILESVNSCEFPGFYPPSLYAHYSEEVQESIDRINNSGYEWDSLIYSLNELRKVAEDIHIAKQVHIKLGEWDE